MYVISGTRNTNATHRLNMHVHTYYRIAEKGNATQHSSVQHCERVGRVKARGVHDKSEQVTWRLLFGWTNVPPCQICLLGGSHESRASLLRGPRPPTPVARTQKTVAAAVLQNQCSSGPRTIDARCSADSKCGGQRSQIKLAVPP